MPSLVQLGCAAVAVLAGLMLGPVTLSGLPHISIVPTSPAHRPAPAKPYQALLKTNSALQSATVLFNNTIKGSETVSVLPDGSLLMLDKYGFAFLAAPDSTASGGYALDPTPIAQLGPARPLGFKVGPDGDVYVCNGAMGLLKMQLPKAGVHDRAVITLLGSRVSADSPLDPGTPILYANALDIDQDGTVYFSDSQAVPVLPNYGRDPNPWYDTFRSYLLGLYSGQVTGRLLVYHSRNSSIHVLHKGLWFANGVALSPAAAPGPRFVVVAETNRMRLTRYWLNGAQAGTADVLIDQLPGVPDGVSTTQDGDGFWVALAVPHTKLFDLLLKSRLLRVVMAYLPAWATPPVKQWGAVAKVSLQGEMTQLLLDPTAERVSLLSAVEEVKLPTGRRRLFMASVNHHWVAYLDL